MNPMMAERSVSQKADSLTEGASELLLSSFSRCFFFSHCVLHSVNNNLSNRSPQRGSLHFNVDY